MTSPYCDKILQSKYVMKNFNQIKKWMLCT